MTLHPHPIPTRSANPRSSAPATRSRPPLREGSGADHVLAMLMEEHRCFLEKLDRIEAIAGEDLRSLVLTRRLALLEEVHRLAEDLIAAEPHHQREEEVLFPALREHGGEDSVGAMLAEHDHLRAQLERLERSTMRALRADGRGWTEVMDLGRALTKTLRAHIQQEDEVLYPLAYRLIGDPRAWAEMRGRFETIGCCSRAHH